MISLVVSTRGRSRELDRLFISLLTQTYKDFEVIVADQNDDDRIHALCTESWPFPVHHIRTTARGASRGRNLGLGLAKGDIVLFPDDDCWYPSDFLYKGLLLIDATGCGFVSGRAATSDGSSINGRYEESPGLITRGNVWTSGIEWVTFWKRHVLELTGGFNPDIGPGASTPWGAADGQDLMLRALAAGQRGFYFPSLYGHHQEFDIETGHDKARIYGRGAGYVLRIHRYGLLSMCKWLVRPIGGVLLSLARGRLSRARYYMNVAIGRLEGYVHG